MRLPDENTPVEIESFVIPGGAPSGRYVSLRPILGQKFPRGLLVEGNKSLCKDYPVGTRFKVKATLMQRADGSRYLFSSWQWDVQVLALPDQAPDGRRSADLRPM
jgi:hypothetical protein